MIDPASDIPLELARRAHSGTSFSPERRADQERSSYANTLAGDYASLSEYATSDDKRATLDEEFRRYRAGYRARYLAYLGARSRCMSTMITGGSNFPVERQRRRNAHADKKTDELLSFRTRALAAIRKALCPELRPIMAGDADATHRLAEKITKAKALQSTMRAANNAIRKHARSGETAQVTALVALGISEHNARELLKPDFMGRIGFAPYQLTNNNANIRRMESRLGAVSVSQATPATEEHGQAARLEDCPAENRVRLFFPGKPSAEVRSRLKRVGFRWTPSIGCWQAYRNTAALSAARREAEVDPTPVSGPPSANHELAAGKLCTEGSDGFCTVCGVAMTTCDVCAGIGYHAKGCPESDE
jgi:hypothetical protein